jgi:DNA polymerase III subunit epsilon
MGAIKILYFDVETTGVMYWKNGIHQISGAIEIDGEIKEEFNFLVQPNPSCTIEQVALDVGGVTKEQIMSYPPMGEVFKSFLEMMAKYVDKFDKKDKFFLIGYNNSSFDNQFLRAWFVQNGDNYFGSWFWSSSMDVMVLASEFLKDCRHNMIDFKLKTVAKEVGLTVDESKLHDASYDILLTREIYKHVTA